MKLNRIMKIGGFLLSAVAFASSCSSPANKTNTSAASTSSSTPAEEPLKGCYIAVIKKDTIQLAITDVKGNRIEGSLIYDFAEKDKSTGSFTGEYKDGILLANYVFYAEGTTSERPVIFKKVSEGFVEGFGETKHSGDKEVFADVNAVDFEQRYPLKYTETCLP